MLILSSAAPSTLDNILTISLVAVLALIVFAVVIRKALADRKTTAETPVADPIVSAEAPKAPGTAGQVKLHDVEPKTAAMLMAIVADKLQKPINELRFVSIKEVK